MAKGINLLSYRKKQRGEDLRPILKNKTLRSKPS